jgi:hypothetical protein
VQLVEVVEPKLILYEYRNIGMYGIQKSRNIVRRVSREIKYKVGKRVVLAYLIARRGEEGDDNNRVWHLALYALDDGTTLFKLSKRCSVYPHHMVCDACHTLFDTA